MLITTLDNYPGYEFRDDGTAWSFRIRGGQRKASARRPVAVQLLGKRTEFGYIQISIKTADGDWVKRSLHRLVYEAFHGPIPAGLNICHNNGNPSDNRLSNLRCDTQSGNMSDCVSHGTDSRGAKNVRAKLTTEQARYLRFMYSRGVSQGDLASQFGVHLHTISKIVRNISYKETA